MSQIEQLSSVKGKPMIIHECYIYTVERTTKTKSIFLCKNRDCKARCHTSLSMEAFLSHPTSHCRAPQLDSVPAIQLKNEIKARAARTDESTSTTIHSTLRTYPLSDAGQLSKIEPLILMIQRQHQIITGFDLICDQFDNDADDLLEYFEKTCIGEPKIRTDRKKPQFDHRLWNIHDRVVATVPRPNNSVEGWHNAFADRVEISHPTIVKLGEKIRREQSKCQVDMTKILQSHDIKTKKACYRKLDEHITRLANSFDPTQLDQFLKNMAANITLW
ncbi:unnamed protein product, partial [Rotaria magnacalcarata]